MISESRAFALLVELYRRGGRITPQGERLIVSGATQALSSDIRIELAHAKPALVMLLGGHGESNDTRDGVPLSGAQQEIWAVEQALPGTTRFNLTSNVLLRGRFSTGAAADALAALIERHAALRTRFAQAPLACPRQFVRAATGVAADIERGLQRLPENAGALLRQIALEQNARPFDLAGGPLFGLHMLTFGDGHVVLTLRRHHIASDGVSFALLVDDFCRFYRAFADGDTPSVSPPLGYPAFVAYEAAALERQGPDTLRTWWRDALGGSAAYAEPSIAMDGAATGSLRFVIDATTTGALRDLARRCGESLYSTMFALFRVLLEAHEAPGAECVGVDASMRDAAEFDRTVGLFINRLPIVHPFDPNAAFVSMIEKAGRKVRAALAHKWLAHHEFGSLRRTRGQPLFSYLFGFHNNAHATFALPDCRLLERFAHREHEQDVPFVCYLTDVGAALSVSVAYRATPQLQTLAVDFAAAYRQLARFAIVTPDIRCGDLVASLRARRRSIDADRRRAFAEFKRRRPAADGGHANA
ncbi:condensation domain-containing protein [Paraburkholderia caledonica]|uniref:Condensation domain-containing protein n=1 Tax=Paraburkholderia caledonica TaxID=134536 RepID=A0AB73IHY3_9BURK|nr:hypothetical protein [Paraburkholderia caledonica]